MIDRTRVYVANTIRTHDSLIPIGTVGTVIESGPMGASVDFGEHGKHILFAHTCTHKLQVIAWERKEHG